MDREKEFLHREIRDPSAKEMGYKALPTGNWTVSIPRVNIENGAIESIGFLHWQYRALVEVSGDSKTPFLAPFLSVDGKQVPFSELEWSHELCWIPFFKVNWNDVHFEGRLVAPIGERGFFWALEAWCESRSAMPREVTMGWTGCWTNTVHAAHLPKKMQGSRYAGINGEYSDSLYLEFRSTIPIFAIGATPSEPMDTQIALLEPESLKPGFLGNESLQEVATDSESGISYKLRFTTQLQPGEGESAAIYIGLGLKEISAVGSARDLKRRGWRELLATTRTWLTEHGVAHSDPKTEALLNRNMFYNYFFSQGICLDSEELALVSSRTSKSRSVAIYRDRDAMLRSLPGLLNLDPNQAQKVLEFAFTTQLRNIGLHSRFVDGAVLQPGFQLDQLCAPIQALAEYVRVTKDRSILFDRRVQSGVNHILENLEMRRHPEHVIYATVLSPDDDTSPLPYATYSNAMVWRMLCDLAAIYGDIGDLDRADEMNELAKKVKTSINNFCIIDTPHGPAYASAVDLRGNHSLEDWTNASLKHLPLLGFCSKTEPVYVNTLSWIAAAEDKLCRVFENSEETSKGCALVSLLNEILLGSEEALQALRSAKLDEGIACESLDAEGFCFSGPGNAALAGMLAHTLRSMIKEIKVLLER